MRSKSAHTRPHNNLKKILISLSCLITPSISLSAPIPPLADLQLEQCVQDIVNENNWTQLEQITNLECEARGIKNLDGLQVFLALTELKIANNPLEFVDPLFLAGSPKLEKLDISYTSVHLSNALPSIAAYQDQLVELSMDGVLLGSTQSVPPLPNSLQSLSVADNNIRDINFIRFLPDLVALDIANNPIESTGPLSNISGLQALDISHTDISYWDPAWHWPQMEKLDLSYLSLDNWFDVNVAVSQMHQLRELSLAGAPIDGVWMSSIFDPTTIEVLDLSYTDSSVVPLLEQFVSLERLHLRGLGLDSLQGPLGYFNRLETLDLADNDFVYFDLSQFISPPSVRLKHLSLANNKLDDLIIPYPYGAELVELDLDGNRRLAAFSVSNTLSQLPNLERLGLAYVFEDMTQLDAVVFKDRLTHLNINGIDTGGVLDLMAYPNLEQLQAEDGNIKDVFGLEFTESLTVLNLKNNQLNSLFVPPSLQRLDTLNLADNNLFTLDLTPFSTSFKHLDLSGNTNIDYLQLETLLGNQGVLQTLDLSYTSAQWNLVNRPHFHSQLRELGFAGNRLEITAGSIEQFTSLRSIDLSDNFISDVLPIFQLDNLRSLNLANNQIFDFYPPFNPNLRLRQLDLSDNPIYDSNQIINFVQTQLSLTHLGLNGISIDDFNLLQNLPSLQELRLANCNLQDNIDIYSFERLQYLDLQRNRISSISGIENLAQLQYLNLAGNDLLYISGLHPEVQLESIDLSGNQEFDLDSFFFSNPLSQLTSLGLADLNITDLIMIPLAQFPELRNLKLSDNNFDSLQSLDQLLLLETLDVSNNCLIDSAALSQLFNLKELVFRNTCATQLILPPYSESGGIVALDIRDNDFSGPLPLADLYEIEKLAISITDPTQYYDLVQALQASGKLRELNIENAPIFNLDELPLYQLESLERLELSNGQLQSLIGIESLPNLISLNINSNQVTFVDSLFNLSRLEEFSALDNPIQNLSGLSALNTLKILRVDGNNMLDAAEVNMILNQQRGLEALELHNLNVPAVWELFSPSNDLLSELILSNNQLTDLAGIDAFTRLKSLVIEGNDIVDIAPLAALEKLEQLRISQNQSSIFTPNFPPLPNLQTLILNQTPFDFPDNPLLDISYLANLEHLELAGWSINDLNFLSQQIQGQLTTLNLSNTGINEDVMQSAFWLERLVHLDLSDNNFTQVDFLISLPQLQWLNLAGNALLDIDALLNNPVSLSYLNLLDNEQISCYDLDLLEINNPQMQLVRPLACALGASPSLAILSPIGGDTYSNTDLILFNASANDPEDGPLFNQIIWSSSISGVIGSGSFFESSLVEGNHIITVSVTDSDGNETSQELNIQVSGGALQYCAAFGNSTNYEWVDSVDINGQVFVTGSNGGYQDNTSNPARLLALGNQLILSAGYQYGSYVENWQVWIDWNQDGVFDGSEQVASLSGMFSVSASFDTPSNIQTGIFRMRVAMSWGSFAQACGNFSWGEVEDFDVIF